ncbi:hypothetical protein BS17DRAFT_779108 [Gyrodon lividus]|nr:hypothetical protein BS17DRAFT_779108 [Gyrodon lividus]
MRMMTCISTTLPSSMSQSPSPQSGGDEAYRRLKIQTSQSPTLSWGGMCFAFNPDHRMDESPRLARAAQCSRPRCPRYLLG